MEAGAVVKLDFPLLEPLLSGLETKLVESLDGIRLAGVQLDCGVDNSIGANSENAF